MSSASFPRAASSLRGAGYTPAGVPATFPVERPLDDTQFAALEQALRALHRDLRGLLATLPVDAQSASGLARSLEVERTTCQRAVSAVNQPYPGVELVGQLPGVAGLRGLVEAARLRWAQANEIQEAARLLNAAVDDYADVLRRLAGSRAKLLARISAADAHEPPPAEQHETHARQLFTAAAALTGRQSQTWLAVHIFEPSARPDRLEQTRAHGLIQHVAREDAVPLTFHVFATPTAGLEAADDVAELGRFHPLAPGPATDSVPAELLRLFSSDPPPIVRARQPNEFLVQTVDPSTGSHGACDLVFGLRGRMAHPLTAPPFMEEVWALVNFPVRWLLLDVFLHRDVARRCIPGVDVHLWRPDFAATVGERWQTRFATGPRLEVLGGGLKQTDSPAYARQRELLHFLFQSRHLNPADYVGYRCQVEYPLWRTGYRMTFDFGEPT
ncbi:MAG: hypothetical protein IPM18_00470 [Phycisphaerales bacterium]|nr:hypothetical protein [Phycisphaerales bacterium]